MKVYVVTSGEYSDYCISAVFLHKEDAEAYEFGDDIEEYELHDGPIEVRTWHTLYWQAHIPDRDVSASHTANPSERSDRRDFDGNPKRVEHRWDHVRHYERTTNVTTEAKSLVVQGWDLERVRKVYSEQRAQFIARQDMGVEGCTDE